MNTEKEKDNIIGSRFGRLLVLSFYGRNKYLSPILSFVTHSEGYFLAPFINWKQILDNIHL